MGERVVHDRNVRRDHVRGASRCLARLSMPASTVLFMFMFMFAFMFTVPPHTLCVHGDPL